MKLPYLSQLVIPKSFDECVTYEKQILWLKSQIDTIAGGGDPEIISTLSEGLKLVTKDVEQLKSDVSSIDISAINESIEQINQEIENIKSSIANKQDKLTFDVAPTENSQNPVYSGGVKSYVDNSVRDVEQQVNRKVDKTTFNQAIQNITDNYDTSEEVDTKLSGYAEKTSLDSYAKKTDLDRYATTESLSSYATTEELSGYATVASLDDKQDKLVFDQTPTLGSNNPVTSNGVKAALNSIPSVTLDDTVTESGVNAVRSSGVYSFVENEIVGLATKEELAQYETTESVNTKLESYATKSELGSYATTEELNSKQDSLTFDQTPTLDSQNPVTSDGIKKAIDAMVVSPIEIDQVVSGDSSNAVSSSGVYNFVVDQVSGLATTEQLANKQDKLTFDNTPTEGSNNPVTSDGIKKAINSIPSVTLDDTVTAEGTNAVKSSGVYNFVTDQVSGLATTEQLANKQDKLTFDNTPTEGSNNPVTSDGIKKAIDSIPSVTLDDTVTAEGTNAVKSSGVYNFVVDQVSGLATTEQLANKQDKLTFDNTPTEGSNNPVTSSGIKSAIDAIQPLTLDDAVTQQSDNAVKSSGIYSFVNDQVSGKQDTLTFDDRPTRESTNPVTSGGVFNALAKSWTPVGTISLVLNDSRNGITNQVITANVRLQSGGYGAQPTSIVVIDFEYSGTVKGLYIAVNGGIGSVRNYFTTTLGNIEMMGSILSGVLVNGDDKYPFTISSSDGELVLNADSAITSENLKIKLIGIVTANL